MNLKILKRHEY